MAFPLTLDHVPSIAWGEMGNINETLRPVLNDIRPVHRICMERLFLGALEGREFLVLQAIVSRTFGWGKFIEMIALSMFEHGMRDRTTGQLMLDDKGIPYFSGTGLTKKTLTLALDGLAAKGMISRFVCQTGGRDAFAYMPFSASSLAFIMAQYGHRFDGELPESAFGGLATTVSDELATVEPNEPASDLEKAFRSYILGERLQD